MVNQFGMISRSHYNASTCPLMAYARSKKWTWGESQSESTSSLQYPPLQFSSLFLQHFFFNLVILYLHLGLFSMATSDHGFCLGRNFPIHFSTQLYIQPPYNSMTQAWTEIQTCELWVMGIQ